MRDCSFTVERGMDQSILCNIFTTEALTTRKNLTGCTVTAFIGSGMPTITKQLRIVDAAQGIAALDLTPAESRLILSGQRMDAEIELREAGLQIIVGRGRVTGLGGINLDT